MLLQQGTGPDDWHGSFAPGDRLLAVIGLDNVISTTTIDFEVPLVAVGAQIENNVHGPFLGRIHAFNEAGDMIGSFTRAGDSEPTNDNTAIFIGLRSEFQDIDKITFNIIGPAGPTDDSYAINRVDLLVPEPASLSIVLFLLLPLSASRRREIRR